ncbi:DegT/DnrJ/EryC1/StrS family aminotransferase [Candidatus Bathyarchaeota archaeon]|nr:DegT/DnrJ/EryC1/StrS family aminotransferase [Candidatus Bathyarchaeota archaeon]
MLEKRIIQVARTYFPEEDIELISKDVRTLLASGRLLGIGGIFTQRFEKAFASYIGTRYAVATSSGTSALVGALRALGVKKGSEVIVPTNTFLASPNSVMMAGGKAILSDINEKSLCLDVDDAAKRITDKTVGIMVVHIHGLVCPEIEELVDLCRDKGLFLIEDAAHAHGALFKGKKAGSLADAGCFSFYPTKIITSGEGGMVCTNDESMAEEIKILRYDGIGADNLHVDFGDNWHMTEMSSILGIYQLNRLEEFLKRRNEIAMRYRESIREIDGLTTIEVPSHSRCSFYKFPVIVDEGIDAVLLMQELKSKYGIETGQVYYPPCHLQPIYKKMFGYEEGMLPVSERILKRMVCLPMHVQLTDSDVDYVLNSLRLSMKNFRSRNSSNRTLSLEEPAL